MASGFSTGGSGRTKNCAGRTVGASVERRSPRLARLRFRADDFQADRAFPRLAGISDYMKYSFVRARLQTAGIHFIMDGNALRAANHGRRHF